MFTSRTFLRVSATAAGGFVASLYFDDAVLAQQSAQPQHLNYPPDAFIHIKPDGQIIIHVNRIEMGQGVHTALPIVLADELDADWSQVVPELAPAADVYKDPVAGFQFVGGSGSVAHSFQQYRELGAKMRAMLVAAAAERWKVMPAQCRTESSIVRGPAGQTAKYAELAERADRRPQLRRTGRQACSSRRRRSFDSSARDFLDSIVARNATVRKSSDSIWTCLE